MKKLVALMLTLTLALCVTACGGTGNNSAGNGGAAKDDTEGKAAVDILTDVWGAYKDDEKFALAGGDYENMVSDAPGAVNVADGEMLDSLLGFPAAQAELLDDGASMMHMMNQNTFTAAAYHVADAANVADVAAALKDNIMNRQWMCGFPDDLVIYSVGTNYVVAAFGAEEVVDTFEDHLEEVYASAEDLYDEDLTF